MTIQNIIDSAQSIEISRPALVASSMSRSGRLFTAARNWSKPIRITVVPKPVFRISEARAVIEGIMNTDRHTEQLVSLGTGGASWCVAYQGSVGTTDGRLNGVTVVGFTNTSITLTGIAAIDTDTVILRAGDLIQPAGHRYPYFVRADVIKLADATEQTFLVHRGFLEQEGYTPAGAALIVGTACTFTVKVSNLPDYRYIPGQLVEFTDDFELIESVI